MLTLYFTPGASSMAVHIALHEVGVAFEVKRLSLASGDNRAPDYLALNPEGKVPLLLVDGRPLTEVAGILFYLARAFPKAGLLPIDEPEAEARVVSWMSFVASTVHPVRRQGADACRAVLALAEQRLGGRDWAVDDHSIADIHLFRLYWRLRNAFNLGADEFPGLESHWTRMMKRPAVIETIRIESSFGYELSGWQK